MTYIWPTGHRVELLIQFALKHSRRFISFRLFYHFRDHFPSRPLLPTLSSFSDLLIELVDPTMFARRVTLFPSTLPDTSESELLVGPIRWKVERYRKQNQPKFVHKRCKEKKKKRKLTT